MPIQTGATGNFIITVRPWEPFGLATTNPTSNTLPFVSCSTSAVTLPFASVPAQWISWPTNFKTSVASYGIDAVRLTMNITQNALNIQGRMISSWFYSAPNATWNRTQTGVYNLNTISIAPT